MAGQHEIPLVPCPHEARLEALEKDYRELSGNVAAINTDLHSIVKDQVSMQGDIKLLMHKTDTNALESKQRHIETKEMFSGFTSAINRFSRDLKDHMDAEPEHIKAAISPLTSDVGEIKKTALRILVWSVLVLGSALVTSVTFIFLTGVRP